MSTYPGNDICLGADRITGQPVMLSRHDRARHTYLVGGTRTGKTKLVEQMCRQDILQWPNDHCPLLVLDPHGTLYKGLMAFIAAEDLKEWPIIPVDLSRGDMIVSYNLLRRRHGVDPSVICRAFIDAMIHAWNMENTNQTPRLATWLHTLLMLAYEREHTLTEALQIIANPELRRIITHQVEDFVVRSVIQSVEHVREKEFQERVESTLYRINRFLSGQILRATFCQKGESLDLGEVLDQGKIVLVNLSVEGTNIHAEDASVFGSVMLTDLWTAANRRGKREDGERPPCYVYVDECQNFVGPTIAKGMAEASGFGLHLHLINQWPSQLLSHGRELGRLILDSILNNAQNKIVFKVEHPDDLEMLTRILFRQSVNPKKIKDEIISPTVVGYDLEYHKSYSNSESHGTTHSWEESYSHSKGRSVGVTEGSSIGINRSEGMSEGTSDAETLGISESDGLTLSDSRSATRSRGQSASESENISDTNSDQWAASDSRGTSSSSALGTNNSQSHSFRRPSKKSQSELDEYLGDELDVEEEDEFKRKWATAASLSEGESATESTSESQSTSATRGSSHSRAKGHSCGRTVSEQQSEGETHGTAHSSSRGSSQSKQHGRSRSKQRSSGYSLSASMSTSTTENEQETHGFSEGVSESESHTVGEGLNPMLMPRLENRVSSRQFETVEEQLFQMSQLIDAQRLRQCFVRLASATAPVPVITEVIEPPRTTEDFARQKTTQIIASLPFMLPFAEADRNVRERQVTLVSAMRKVQTTDEPVTTRRRITAREMKGGEKN